MTIVGLCRAHAENDKTRISLHDSLPCRACPAPCAVIRGWICWAARTMQAVIAFWNNVFLTMRSAIFDRSMKLGQTARGDKSGWLTGKREDGALDMHEAST